MKSAIYDAATDTVYLVPVNKVKPFAFNTPFARQYPFVVESPSTLEEYLQLLKAPPTNAPAIAQGISNLTDTSGNPIATGTGSSDLLSTDGSFAAYPSVAKASPSVLSYLFGTPTHATPKAKPKPTHKAK